MRQDVTSRPEQKDRDLEVLGDARARILETNRKSPVNVGENGIPVQVLGRRLLWWCVKHAQALRNKEKLS